MPDKGTGSKGSKKPKGGTKKAPKKAGATKK